MKYHILIFILVPILEGCCWGDDADTSDRYIFNNTAEVIYFRQFLDSDTIKVEPFEKENVQSIFQRGGISESGACNRGAEFDYVILLNANKEQITLTKSFLDESWEKTEIWGESRCDKGPSWECTFIINDEDIVN